MRNRLLAPVLLASTCLFVEAPAQLSLGVCTEGIGRPSTYSLAGGRPGFPFLFLTSFQRGSFPLSAIDPRDSRKLGVGLDLLSLLIVANFDGSGKANFKLPIPNDSSLVGKALLHQVLAYPGTSTTFGEISNVAVMPLDVRSKWKLDKAKNMFFARAWTTVLAEGDGEYLAAGGGTGGLLALQAFDTSDRFDLATRAFKAGPKMTTPRGVHTASQLQDKRWLLVAGVNGNNDPQDTCEFYDPAKRKFAAGPKMVAKRMAHTATVLKDGRVFVTGGLSDLNNQLQALQSALKSTEIYDPKTNKWTRGPDMREPKAGHSAVLMDDGRVLIGGGVTWRFLLFIKIPSFSKAVDVYDPKTGKIAALATMSKERAGFACVRLSNGRVLAAGGVNGSITTGGSVEKACEIYDPKTNRWSSTAALPVGKALGSTVVLSNGNPAVLGGAIGTLLKPLAVDDCVAFDVATSKWISMPKLVTPRATHSAIASPSCALFVVGGGTGASGAAVGTAEVLIQ